MKFLNDSLHNSYLEPFILGISNQLFCISFVYPFVYPLTLLAVLICVLYKSEIKSTEDMSQTEYDKTRLVMCLI